MLKIQPIAATSEFALTVTGAAPALSTSLEKEVESLWQAEQERRGKALFNGRILSACEVSHDGIHGVVVEYRQLIAQRARPELADVLGVRPVAVSGLLICADGIVFGRRSNAMTQEAGLWELVPSGGIDTGAINGASQISYRAQILTELDEEIGLSADAVSSVEPFCVIDDTVSHVLDIGIKLETPLSQDEILAAYKARAELEYETLRILSRAEVPAFLAAETDQVVAVSTALLDCFQTSDP